MDGGYSAPFVAPLECAVRKVNLNPLGTTAEEIEKNLKMVFDRATRWDCVLLLDEADGRAARSREPPA